MNTTIGQYEVEFGQKFAPTKAELEMLSAAGLIDVSYHNDTCPCWAFMFGDGDTPMVRIFVDAIEPADRENLIRHRIGVYTTGPEGDEDGEILYEGSRLDTAIAQAVRYRNRFEASQRLSQQQQNLEESLARLRASIADAQLAANEIATALAVLKQPDQSVLQRALAAQDLDDAAKLIQDALGVTTGDLAAVFLSDLDPEHNDEPTIRAALLEYIEAEVKSLSDEAVHVALHRNDGPDYDPEAGRDWLFLHLTLTGICR